MEFWVVPVSKGLARQVLQFRRKVYDEASPTIRYTFKKEPPSLESVMKDMKTSKNRPVAILALHDGEVIGEAFADTYKEILDIAWAVAEEARGSGVIYALAYALSDRLIKINVREVTAFVLESNKRSIRFLERVGARRVEKSVVLPPDERWGKRRRLLTYIVRTEDMMLAAANGMGRHNIDIEAVYGK